MTESESTWLISAFQLTFASFLLVSGRISDVYNPSTYPTYIMLIRRILTSIQNMPLLLA
jgi:MFS family permease